MWHMHHTLENTSWKVARSEFYWRSLFILLSWQTLGSLWPYNLIYLSSNFPYCKHFLNTKALPPNAKMTDTSSQDSLVPFYDLTLLGQSLWSETPLHCFLYLLVSGPQLPLYLKGFQKSWYPSPKPESLGMGSRHLELLKLPDDSSICQSGQLLL